MNGKSSLEGHISSLHALEGIVKKADNELFENLRLFVERIMLYRITRTKEKGAELARFATILLEAGKMREDSKVVTSEEISSFESLANEKLSASDVAGLFSALADALENLDAKQLYYFLERLRNGAIASH